MSFCGNIVLSHLAQRKNLAQINASKANRIPPAKLLLRLKQFTTELSASQVELNTGCR